MKMERTIPFKSYWHKEICHGQAGCLDGIVIDKSSWISEPDAGQIVSS
jgi:hypothetical protein